MLFGICEYTPANFSKIFRILKNKTFGAEEDGECQMTPTSAHFNLKEVVERLQREVKTEQRVNLQVS